MLSVCVSVSVGSSVYVSAYGWVLFSCVRGGFSARNPQILRVRDDKRYVYGMINVTCIG